MSFKLNIMTTIDETNDDELFREINNDNTSMDNINADELNEEQEIAWEKRMKQMESASKIMGKLLLSGWTMEKDICSTCNSPLFSKNGGHKLCPLCDMNDDGGEIKRDNNDDNKDVTNDDDAGNTDNVSDNINDDVVVDNKINEINDTFDDDNYWGYSDNKNKKWLERQRKSDEGSRECGKLLLKGWTMLSQSCKICATPLMKYKNGLPKCVVCDKNKLNNNSINNNNSNNTIGNSVENVNNEAKTRDKSSQNSNVMSLKSLKNIVNQKMTDLRGNHIGSNNVSTSNDNINSNDSFNDNSNENKDNIINVNNNNNNNNNDIRKDKLMNIVEPPSYIINEMKAQELKTMNQRFNSMPPQQSIYNGYPPNNVHPQPYPHPYQHPYPYPPQYQAPYQQQMRHNKLISFGNTTDFWLNKTLTNTIHNCLSKIDTSNMNDDISNIQSYLDCINTCIDIRSKMMNLSLN